LTARVEIIRQIARSYVSKTANVDSKCRLVKPDSTRRHVQYYRIAAIRFGLVLTFTKALHTVNNPKNVTVPKTSSST